MPRSYGQYWKKSLRTLDDFTESNITLTIPARNKMKDLLVVMMELRRHKAPLSPVTWHGGLLGHVTGVIRACGLAETTVTAHPGHGKAKGYREKYLDTLVKTKGRISLHVVKQLDKAFVGILSVDLGTLKVFLRDKEREGLHPAGEEQRRRRRHCHRQGRCRQAQVVFVKQ
jgi:hypothetical protein